MPASLSMLTISSALIQSPSAFPCALVVFAVVAHTTNPKTGEHIGIRVEVFVFSDFCNLLDNPLLSFFVCFHVKGFVDEHAGSETVDAQSLGEFTVFLFDSHTVDVKLSQDFVELLILNGRLCTTASGLEVSGLIIDNDELAVRFILT